MSHFDPQMGLFDPVKMWYIIGRMGGNARNERVLIRISCTTDYLLNTHMGSEAEEAKALCKYMQLKHPAVYEHMLHIKNEGKSSARAGFQANLIGRKKGVPDYFIAIPVGRYHGLWLELKAGKGKPTKEQKEWLHRLAKRDYACTMAWGWEAAAQCIEQYINGQVDRIIIEDLVEQ